MGYYLRLLFLILAIIYVLGKIIPRKERIFVPFRGPLKFLQFSVLELSSALAHNLTKPLTYE